MRFDLVDQDAVTAFDALVAEALPLITDREPGTLQYAVHSVRDEPLARVFYELYADAEAFAAHEAAPHTSRMLEAFGPLLSAAPRVEHFASVDGKHLPDHA
ncbi:putative quinol monooxygenase [Aquipuribacter hungaricus]|uniref:Quinol monooxygenase n=1 Tax=Aquipuribacter hungaricus TaxID=545624 RepID=A0ABV7WFQ9_9MICO